jgi:tRNA threonylcarbamoyladenosine biosynthesis protein TsaE
MSGELRVAKVASLNAPDIAATESLGRRLAARLFPGAVVALIGPLGAGKTHLTRALVAGLGGDARRVASPTFALIHEYDARWPVYHFDAYRLPNVTAFAELGVDEYFGGDGICVIEWADRVESALPGDYLRIEIAPTGETSRSFQIEARGQRYQELLDALSRPA